MLAEAEFKVYIENQTTPITDTLEIGNVSSVFLSVVTVMAKTEPKLRQELNRQISFIRCFVLCNIGDI